MVTVKIRETYDLSTKQGKMTLIGIHTPNRDIIQRLYPGFCMQYKRCKIISQTVAVACASRLALNPLQVGVSAGAIAPADVFNPILYKAVSNQSLSNLEARLHGLRALAGETTIDGASVITSKENVTDIADEFQVYYGLLQNAKGFRQRHPQAGLIMRNLRPLVFEKWYNVGQNFDADNVITDPMSDGSMESDTYPVESGMAETRGITNKPTESMRGRAHPMPSFDTTYLTGVRGGDATIGTVNATGMADGQPRNAQVYMPNLARVFTGLIVLPPNKLSAMYYRLVVETKISFFGVRDISEITTLAHLGLTIGPTTHWQDYDYANPESSLTKDSSTLTVNEDAEIEKIMETAQK